MASTTLTTGFDNFSIESFSSLFSLSITEQKKLGKCEMTQTTQTKKSLCHFFHSFPFKLIFFPPIFFCKQFIGPPGPLVPPRTSPPEKKNLDHLGCLLNNQGTHQTRYILRPDHPGGLSSPYHKRLNFADLSRANLALLV